MYKNFEITFEDGVAIARNGGIVLQRYRKQGETVTAVCEAIKSHIDYCVDTGKYEDWDKELRRYICR